MREGRNGDAEGENRGRKDQGDEPALAAPNVAGPGPPLRKGSNKR